MSNAWIRQIGLFILLVILQAGLFDRIHLLGYATPLLYIYFIIHLPVDLNRNMALALSALMGLCIDLFSYTLGIHFLACVIAGFVRYYLLILFAPREMFESCIPSFNFFGKNQFTRYASLMILIHQVILFTAESFSLFDWKTLLYRIAGSFALTLLLVYTFEFINSNANRK